MGILSGVAPAIIAGGFSAFGASKQNEAARDRAIEAMKFSARMSRTAYQRSMADMRAAGLNPILAYQRGGATSPTGVTAQTVNEMEGAVSSAMAARRQTADLKQIDTGIENTKANTKNTKIMSHKAVSENQKIKADTRVANSTVTNLNLERMILVEKNLQEQYNTSALGAKTNMDKQQYAMAYKFLSTNAGKAAWLADKVGSSINPFSSAYRNIR